VPPCAREAQRRASSREPSRTSFVFRFANGLFELIWDHRYVDHVQITVAEDLGVEGRGGYYDDQAGALRDIVQNHIFVEN
jgi:glucose-6-phosphate 1-dehydrogenase